MSSIAQKSVDRLGFIQSTQAGLYPPLSLSSPPQSKCPSIVLLVMLPLLCLSENLLQFVRDVLEPSTPSLCSSNRQGSLPPEVNESVFRAVTFDDISKQREKYNERLKQIEAKERDLAENGGAVHPEMERQLEKMSAATWQIEQRLRVLDFIEEEKNKAVGSDVRKSLKRHDEIEEEDESDSDEGGCESDSDDSDEDESEEEDEKDCSESEEDEEQRTSHGPVPEKTATGKENTPPSNAR